MSRTLAIIALVVGLLVSYSSQAADLLDLLNPSVSSYTIQCNKDTTQCKIRLSQDIGTIDQYYGLLDFLYSSSKDTNINMFVSGNGGRADSMVAIINAMKITKSNITVIVEGPVHSAHAAIAVSGNKLIVLPGTFFMFHAVSSTNSADKICDSIDDNETDRGIATKSKCKKEVIFGSTNYNRYLSTIVRKLFTSKEMSMLLKGHDMLFEGHIIQNRFDKQ